jgi:hypothetical protein
MFNYENQLQDMVLLRRRQTARVGQPQFLGEKVIHLGDRFELPTGEKPSWAPGRSLPVAGPA